MKEKIYTTLLAVFISIISIAQAPLAKLLELAKLGEEQLGRKHYDSAIISFSKGEKLIGKYNLYHDIPELNKESNKLIAEMKDKYVYLNESLKGLDVYLDTHKDDKESSEVLKRTIRELSQ